MKRLRGLSARENSDRFHELLQEKATFPLSPLFILLCCQNAGELGGGSGGPVPRKRGVAC